MGENVGSGQMSFAQMIKHCKHLSALCAVIILSCSLATAAYADNNRNEEIIASTIQSYSQTPDSTFVTIQQCNIEIIVRYSDFHQCSRLAGVDFSRTLLPLHEVDEIRIGNAGSGRAGIDFNFVSDVTRKLEEAKEIWRGGQISDKSTTIKNLEEASSNRAFEFLKNSNVDYRDELIDCGGVRHFQIRSPLSHFLALRKGVPNEFFYAFQEYYSMCKPSTS